MSVPPLNTRQTAAITMQVMEDLIRKPEFSKLLESGISINIAIVDVIITAGIGV